jgi:hypothetical protein
MRWPNDRMNHSSRSNVSVSSGNEAELVTGSLHGLSYIVQFPRSPNSFFDRTAGSQYTAAASLSGIPSQCPFILHHIAAEPTRSRLLDTMPYPSLWLTSTAASDFAHPSRRIRPISFRRSRASWTTFELATARCFCCCCYCSSCCCFSAASPAYIRSSRRLYCGGLIVVADAVIDAKLCAVFHAANRQRHRALCPPSAVVNLICRPVPEGVTALASTARRLRTYKRTPNRSSSKTFESSCVSEASPVRQSQHPPDCASARMVISRERRRA